MQSQSYVRLTKACACKRTFQIWVLCAIPTLVTRVTLKSPPRERFDEANKKNGTKTINLGFFATRSVE
jgi:hypothetical protein